MFSIGQNPCVKINLDNGVYSFIGESATGKTYLAHLLMTYQHTLPEVCVLLKPTDVVSDVVRLLYVDRGNLPSHSVLIQKALEFANRCIVLLDLKTSITGIDIPRVKLNASKDLIEVIPWY